MTFVLPQTNDEVEVREYFVGHPRFQNADDFGRELNGLCAKFPALIPLFLHTALVNKIEIQGLHLEHGLAPSDLVYAKELFKFVAEQNVDETQNAQFLGLVNTYRDECEARLFRRETKQPEREVLLNLLRYIIEFMGCNGRQMGASLISALCYSAESYTLLEKPDKQLLTTQAALKKGGFRHSFISPGMSAVCVLIDIAAIQVESIQACLDAACCVNVLILLGFPLRVSLARLTVQLEDPSTSPAQRAKAQEKRQLALQNVQPLEERFEIHQTLSYFSQLQSPNAAALKRFHAALSGTKDTQALFLTQLENLSISEDTNTRLTALQYLLQEGLWSPGVISRLGDVDPNVRAECLRLCLKHINAENFPLQKLAQLYLEFKAETALLEALSAEIFLQNYQQLTQVFARRGTVLRLAKEVRFQAFKDAEAAKAVKKGKKSTAQPPSEFSIRALEEVRRHYTECSLEELEGQVIVPPHLLPPLPESFRQHCHLFLQLSGWVIFTQKQLCELSNGLAEMDIDARVCGVLLLQQQTQMQKITLPRKPLLDALFQTAPGEQADLISVCDDMHAYQSDVSFEFYCAVIRTLCQVGEETFVTELFENAQKRDQQFATLLKAHKAVTDFCPVRLQAACSFLPSIQKADAFIQTALAAKGLGALRVYFPALENLSAQDMSGEASRAYQDLLFRRYLEIPAGCEEDEELLQTRVLIAEQILRLVSHKRLEGTLSLRTLGILAVELSLQALIPYRLPPAFKDCGVMFCTVAQRVKIQLTKLLPIAVLIQALGSKQIKDQLPAQLAANLKQLASKQPKENAARLSPEYGIYYMAYYMARVAEMKPDAPLEKAARAYAQYIKDAKVASGYGNVFVNHDISASATVTRAVNKVVTQYFGCDTTQQPIFPASLFTFAQQRDKLGIAPIEKQRAQKQ